MLPGAVTVFILVPQRFSPGACEARFFPPGRLPAAAARAGFPEDNMAPPVRHRADRTPTSDSVWRDLAWIAEDLERAAPALRRAARYSLITLVVMAAGFATNVALLRAVRRSVAAVLPYAQRLELPRLRVGGVPQDGCSGRRSTAAQPGWSGRSSRARVPPWASAIWRLSTSAPPR